MKEKSLSEQIDEAVDYELRTHELKQAHACLVEARRQMRLAEHHLEAPSDIIADDVESVIANALEGVMWRIEREIRDRKGTVPA